MISGTYLCAIFLGFKRSSKQTEDFHILNIFIIIWKLTVKKLIHLFSWTKKHIFIFNNYGILQRIMTNFTFYRKIRSAISQSLGFWLLKKTSLFFFCQNLFFKRHFSLFLCKKKQQSRSLQQCIYYSYDTGESDQLKT